MSNIFEVNNLWKLEKGKVAASKWIESRGTHYRDYESFDNCTLSILKGEEEDCETMVVGHDPICVVCGHEHNDKRNVSCCGKVVICADCGEEIFLSRDKWIQIDDKYYCSQCAYVCNSCGETHRGKPYIKEINICEQCVKEYYAKCECCGDWERKSRLKKVTKGNEYVLVCKGCLTCSTISCCICEDLLLAEKALYLKNHKAICKSCIPYIKEELLTRKLANLLARESNGEVQ